jgi:hypothetical protein
MLELHVTPNAKLLSLVVKMLLAEGHPNLAQVLAEDMQSAYDIPLDDKGRSIMLQMTLARNPTAEHANELMTRYLAARAQSARTHNTNDDDNRETPTISPWLITDLSKILVRYGGLDEGVGFFAKWAAPDNPVLAASSPSASAAAKSVALGVFMDAMFDNCDFDSIVDSFQSWLNSSNFGAINDYTLKVFLLACGEMQDAQSAQSGFTTFVTKCPDVIIQDDTFAALIGTFGRCRRMDAAVKVLSHVIDVRREQQITHVALKLVDMIYQQAYYNSLLWLAQRESEIRFAESFAREHDGLHWVPLSVARRAVKRVAFLMDFHDASKTLPELEEPGSVNHFSGLNNVDTTSGPFRTVRMLVSTKK